MSLNDLYDVVTALQYKPGWTAELLPGYTVTGLESLYPGRPVSLLITVSTRDSRDPQKIIRVAHQFAVPAQEFVPPLTPAQWERWVLDRIIDVERHEAMEFFAVAGRKPFFPDHARGGDPYAIVRRED